NQLAAYAGKRGHRNETWNIVVNSSELKEISYPNVLRGEPLPWKIAMWGSAADTKVLRSVERKFRTVQDLENAQELALSQGPELRDSAGEKGSTEFYPELVGKATVDIGRLKRRRYLLRFPQNSTRYLTNSQVF